MKTFLARINFTGGELSPRLDGRFDVSKWPAGCRKLENMTVVPQGGARKRSGTRHVIQCKNATDDVRMIPFQYSTEQSYMLLFGPGYIWFFKDRGIITTGTQSITSITKTNPAVVTTSGAHGYSNGDYVYITGAAGMTEVNNRWFVVAGAAGTTFQLSGVDSSAYGTYTGSGSVGEIVELSTNYTASEVDELEHAQINDVMYLVHQNHPLAKLSRGSDTSWTLEQPDITTGPFREINPDESFTMTPSAFSAAATAYGTHEVGETFTLTASQPIFESDHVGALFRLFEEGGDVAVPAAPLDDVNVALANGDVYTNAGFVYGVSNLTLTGGSSANWNNFTRVPSQDRGTTRVIAANGAKWFDWNFLHPGYCVVRILSISSDTVATAEIVRYQMPESITSDGTSFWEEGQFSDFRGHPRAVTFFEQRLVLAGTTSEPTGVWLSRSGAYEDFEDGADDDDSVTVRLASGKADVIRWIHGRRILMAGTSAGEYAIAASNEAEALTPTNIKAVLQTDLGTSNTRPIPVNQIILYGQRNGEPENPSKKLREYAYAFTEDKFASIDITIFAEHIFGAGMDRICYQREPDSLIWCRRTDGVLAGCTYERDQEIVAWHRHILGGTDSSVVECEAVPGVANDELWLVVDRTIDGGTQRYVEVMLPFFNAADDVEDAVLVDSSLTYSGASTDTITGLWHLRGETVSGLIDGVRFDATVGATGTLTLPFEGTKVHVGLPFTALLETENLEVGLRDGTAHARMQRINEVYVRVLTSYGGKVGAVGSDEIEELAMQPMEYRRATSPFDTVSLYSGLIKNHLKLGSDRDLRIKFESDDPYPFYISALVAEVGTQ